MHYLLIARFTMDDIPLRLYGSYDRATAEDDAKELHADPTLLDTKWKRSVEKWPGMPGDFVGAIVLSISELDGYPSKVQFDSTAEAAHAPHEPAPPEPSGISRAPENDTSLASAARSLDAENADLRQRVVDLEAQFWSLTNERVSLVSKSEELQRENVAYRRTNDELRALNEDLNHRLSATKARADRATDLEGNLRGTAQHLLAHFQRLEERAKWAFRFADEEMMPLPYARAMLHCQRKFAEEFQGFLHMYPHVLPDIPSEYWPVDDTDDEMND